MNALKKNWRALLALLLVIIAALAVLLGYRPAQKEYEAQVEEITASIDSLQASIESNMVYVAVQNSLEEATQDIADSRTELYEKFPVELKEEDQIMYVLYLEQIFGTEIQFSFGSVSGITTLSDGVALNALVLTVNYETTYQGYKDMIEYLATDSTIVSIQSSTLSYNADSDTATGNVTLLYYLISGSGQEYTEPDVADPETGKESIFE